MDCERRHWAARIRRKRIFSQARTTRTRTRARSGAAADQSAGKGARKSKRTGRTSLGGLCVPKTLSTLTGSSR